MSKVAVIGSGFVGRAWAISFARGGHEVALWDQDPQAPERALAYVEKLLPDLEDNDLLNGATAKAIEAAKISLRGDAMNNIRISS